jgi:hypothetical protein
VELHISPYIPQQSYKQVSKMQTFQLEYFTIVTIFKASMFRKCFGYVLPCCVFIATYIGEMWVIAGG